MHCSRCEDKYHYTCINFSRQDYTALSKELRETWVCPSCKCKEPKSGDNTNTPVRCTGTSTQRQDSGVEHQPQRDAPGFEFENVTLRTRPHSGCTCVSAESIREIIRQELDRKLNSRLDAIQAKLIGFEESLVANHTQNDLLRKENESHRALITVLQKDNEKLRTTSQDLSLRLHVLENLSRSNNLEVQCVPEHKGENLQNTIQQLGRIISCPVTDPDIQYCSRIAKLNNKSPRPRSIIVKFGSRRLRDNFLASVIKYNRNSPKDKLNTSHLGIGGNKKDPIYVTEHLTPETKRLHAAARRVAHQLNYKFVWVRDGKVFLRKSETTGYVHARSEETLKSLT